jgi:hypothetical protein
VLGGYGHGWEGFLLVQDSFVRYRMGRTERNKTNITGRGIIGNPRCSKELYIKNWIFSKKLRHLTKRNGESVLF